MIMITERKSGEMKLVDSEGITIMLQEIRRKLDVLEACLLAIEKRSAKCKTGVDDLEEEENEGSDMKKKQSISPFERLQEEDSFLAYAESFVALVDQIELSEEEMVAKFMEGLRRENSKLIRVLNPKTLRHCIAFGKVLTSNEDPYRSREGTCNMLRNSVHSVFEPNAEQEGSKVDSQSLQGVNKEHIHEDMSRAVTNQNTMYLPPHRRFTKVEEDEKRTRKLCLKCNVNFIDEHQCALRELYPMVREHTEEMEAGSDDSRKSVLGKREKARGASVLGQGLKILDEKVEDLAFDAWQALGDAGNGLETRVVNLTESLQQGGLPTIAGSVAPYSLETGRSFTAKGMEVFESIGKETMDSLNSGTGIEIEKNSKAIKDCAVKDKLFDRCFYIYGGPKQLEELKALSHHHGLLLNWGKAILVSDQKFLSDGKLKDVQQIFDSNQGLYEVVSEADKGRKIEATSEGKNDEIRSLHDSNVNKAAEMGAGFTYAIWLPAGEKIQGLKLIVIALSMKQGTLGIDIRSSWIPDTYLEILTDQVVEGQLSHFTWGHNLLLQKRKLTTDSSDEQKLGLVQIFHTSAASGHLEVHATIIRVAGFCWEGLEEDARRLIQTYETYQRYKGDKSAITGLLQPLHDSTTTGSEVSMGSATGLLKSYEREVVRMVIDKATKYRYVIPIYISCILGKATIKEAEQVLVDSKAIWHCLRFKLCRTQYRRVQMANKKRTGLNFHISGGVVVKLPPYKQESREERGQTISTSLPNSISQIGEPEFNFAKVMARWGHHDVIRGWFNREMMIIRMLHVNSFYLQAKYVDSTLEDKGAAKGGVLEMQEGNGWINCHTTALFRQNAVTKVYQRANGRSTILQNHTRGSDAGDYQGRNYYEKSDETHGFPGIGDDLLVAHTVAFLYFEIRRKNWVEICLRLDRSSDPKLVSWEYIFILQTKYHNYTLEDNGVSKGGVLMRGIQGARKKAAREEAIRERDRQYYGHLEVKEARNGISMSYDWL